MSLPEVAFRIRRIVRSRLESIGLFTASRPPSPVIDDTQSCVFLHAEAIDGEHYREAASRLTEGRVSIFALEHAAEAKYVQWNSDPLTGIVGPLVFGKHLDYRDERVVGNIKYLWEPNRHLELVTLAQAYAAYGDESVLGELFRRLESWLTQCPYPLGANWASSLELGIRLINWSVVWQFVGGAKSELFAGADGAQLRRRWLESIYQHVHFIHHYYSRYSSANNHLIGEAAGVFIAACTWPFWKEFERWSDDAQAILVEACSSQTHEDGVNKEQAVAYQQFVLDFFILAGLAGTKSGNKFPESYWRSIERMIEFLAAIMDVRGNVPMIGDADDGYVTRLSQEPEFCPFRSLLATGAMLFDRYDFASKSGGVDDKTRILLGDKSLIAFPGARQNRNDQTRRQFPDGGYFVLGERLESDREIRIVADAGPLGYLSIAAHGHADALSFVLSVSGREILIDPGTYCYHTEPRWRAYFRGTAAHNTVRIDGQDQSVQGGNFMWLQHANARCTHFETGPDFSRFEGEHDGYTRLDDPVVHRRSVEQRGSMIQVSDHLSCSGHHSMERCWHFSEQCRVTVEDDVTVVAENGPVRVSLTAAEPVDRIIHLRGSDDPPGGWVSRRFDVKEPADSVYFVNEVNGATTVNTTIRCEFIENKQ